MSIAFPRRTTSSIAACTFASCSTAPLRVVGTPSFSSSRPNSQAPLPPADLPDVSVKLREIMRNVAQPVAIAVARVPPSLRTDSAFHGATLTSFTSLTLHPYPLVAFSLRLPSRLADCLRPWIKPPPPPPSAPLSSSISTTSPDASHTNHQHTGHPPDPSSSATSPLTVSLLSLPDHPTAQLLSSRLSSQSSLFDGSQSYSIKWTNHDPPGLPNAIGALRCEILHSIPLCDICGVSTLAATPPGMYPGGDLEASSSAGGLQNGSELFICKVTEVIPGTGEDPLLYWKQRYTTARDGEGSPR